MSISKKIESFIEKSSWIRRMFEQGARLKAEHGADKVFDFSLGNPNLAPPEEFYAQLEKIAKDNPSGVHAYMPNIGYPDTRAAVADYVSGEQGVKLSAADIIMTCGAAGGINVILKAILDPNDEVVTPTPYFVEYGFYVDNHGGRLVPVPTGPGFSLDVSAIIGAVTPKTRAVLINSPNNPSGRVYPAADLEKLGQGLRQASEKNGRTIYLISDEPYRKIVYEGIIVPPMFAHYGDCIITTSYSKDLSIPGERIGFIAVNPSASGRAALLDGMALANRILGFVNAPALMQRVVAKLQGAHVDVGLYAQKRELLCDGLASAGYVFTRPEGAFYLFPEAPGGDDVAFVRALQDELILAVPGTGFGSPGYFRLSYCISDETIIGAMPGFKRAIEKFR
ncbi:MAG: pyridoxal phosphate-dependent aminotransferase [Deltaproteobacteria bacterium]|nr:pyridoxal phosphate-dependent aminotransferase [Deltaproteobacteria bacterium]